jgi:hypothetical protein
MMIRKSQRVAIWESGRNNTDPAISCAIFPLLCQWSQDVERTFFKPKVCVLG